MKVLSITSLFVAAGFTALAQNSAPAPVAPAPVRPMPRPGQSGQTIPGEVPPGGLRPGQAPPPGQVAPGRMTPGQILPGGTQPNSVPRFGTNVFGTPSATNGFDADDLTNRFDRDDFRTNGFGGFTNSSGTNAFGVANGFGTNGDVAVNTQDQVLLRQIRMRLRPEAPDGSLALSIAVQNGAVTLSGAAPSAEEAQEFVNLVQQTPGVVSVDNNIQVVPGMRFGRGFDRDQGFSSSDRELLGQVRRHMGRGRGQAGASESVHIIARNGIITLFGFVSSAAEKQALEAAVQSTPGVVQVNDELRIRSSTAADQNNQNAGTSTVGGFSNTVGSVNVGVTNTSAVGGSTNTPGGVVTGFSTDSGAFGVPPATSTGTTNQTTNGVNTSVSRTNAATGSSR